MAVDATGNGFAYTGSLRWSVEDGVLTSESMAITGGRAVYSDNNWAANYYICDHLGSVRAVTDAEGEMLENYMILQMKKKHLNDRRISEVYYFGNVIMIII